MQKSSSMLTSVGACTVIFAGFCWLLIFLCAPAAVQAGATQASLHSRHRVRHLRASSRRSASLAVGRQTIRRSAAVRSSKNHHVALRRRKTTKSARARRYRLEATLDNIRTHAPTTPASAEQGVTLGATGLTALMPQVASSPGYGSAAQPSGALQHDLPIFSSAVPQYMPIALRGSHEVLVHQNIIADVEGLSRIQNDLQLSAMVHSGDLVALPASGALAVDSRLPMNRRYCRPWTSKFLSDLSRAHENVFGRPLQLTSAVRTVDFQRHLARYNGNAAPAFGDTASPHLTGQAIDLGKKGMSQHEIAWMRDVLGRLQSSGKLDVEEEFEQACFHISVYKTYAPHSSQPERLVATAAAAPDDMQPEDSAQPAIGGLAQPVSEPVVRKSWARRTSAHTVRHAVVHRRRRRHHASMSLLAARMR